MINVSKVPARLSRSLRPVVRLTETLLVLLLCAVTAAAGWRELKPIFGGAVNRIVVDAGGTLFATTGGGLYKSVDNGQTWMLAVGDLPTPSVGALAADPVDSGVFYAGTGQGLYRTMDGGNTWTRLLDLPGITIQEIAVAPTNKKHIFIATWGSYVWRSLDRGANWEQRAGGLYGGWGGPSFIPSGDAGAARADVASASSRQAPGGATTRLAMAQRAKAEALRDLRFEVLRQVNGVVHWQFSPGAR